MTVFARISDAVEQFRRRNCSTSEIRIENDGFRIVHAKLPEDRVKFEEISGVMGYKIDEIATDLICCDIFTISEAGELVRTVHEEMPGFDAMMQSFERLPGFDKDWWSKIAHPPFAENRTFLYKKV